MSPPLPRKNCRASTRTYCWTITASITTAVTAECGHTGKQGQEVILTPRVSQQDIRSICFVVNNRYEPLYIRIDLKNGQQQEILIRTYRALQTASDKEFTFDSKKYPDAEIIDMR